MLKIFRLFLLSYCFISAIIYPQKSGKESILTINDGLSQNSVFTIVQDNKGYIWIGTQDGLNCFDGFEFKVYRNEKNNSSSLSGNFVKSIIHDNRDNLWIGTGNGLSKLNLKTNTFIQNKFPNSLKTLLHNQHITSLFFDSQNLLWIGTRNGLIVFDTKNEKIVDFSGFINSNIIEGKYIFSFLQDSKGNIWIGTFGQGLYRLNFKQNSFEKIEFAGLNLTSFFSIVQITNSDLLLGTYEAGLIQFNIETNSFFWIEPKKFNYSSYIYQILRASEETALIATQEGIFEYYFIEKKFTLIWSNENRAIPRAILIDKSNNLWIGTEGFGLYKMPLGLKKFNSFGKSLNQNEKDISFGSIRAFLIDDKNRLWIGGHSSLNRIDYSNFETNKFEILNEFNGLNVYTLVQDPIDKNIFWIGTECSGLLKYDEKKNSLITKYTLHSELKYFSEVYSSLVASNGNIFWGTDKSLVQYDPLDKIFTEFIHSGKSKNSIVDRKIKALFEDSKGNIWIGSDRDGFSIYYLKQKKFVSFRSSNDKNSLSSNRVNSFCEDRNGTIWIGTENGLNKFNEKDNSFVNYNVNNGFANDFIYGILNDNENNLWLSTNKGLIKFNPNTDEVSNYDYTYGLQSNEFNTCAFYKNKIGEMFFGGVKGFTFFNPAKVKNSIYEPIVTITKFKKNNQNYQLKNSISFTDIVELSHTDIFFSFEFFADDYTYPDRNKYRYKLDGLDERWIYTDSKNRIASFTNINPGEYTLKIGATNSDGVWSSNEASIKIVMHPAYWNTLWFKLLVFSLLFGMAFLLYRSRINLLKQEKEIQRDLTKKLINSQEEERKKISSELHDDLGQNLLVVKNRLMLAKRDKNFDEFINETIDVLDKSISEVSNISHLLHPSELEELGLSQAIESMVYRIKSSSELRIINRLGYIDDYFLPEEKINLFRIIQESLNNVIKHSGASEVQLSYKTYGQDLVLEITDNGVGFEYNKYQHEDNRPRIGLRGMKERVLMLNGNLIVDSNPTSGTTIKIEFKNRNEI